MGIPWEQGGVPVVDETGAIIECDTCPCDMSAECEFCEDGGPLTLDYMLAGVLPGVAFPCADWNDLNATFTTDEATGCQWNGFDLLDAGLGVCQFFSVFTMNDLGGGMVEVEANIAVAFGANNIFKSAPIACPFDCSAPFDLLPDSIDATARGADFSATTITVSP